MATSKQFINELSEKLSAVGEIAFRPMFGEYVVYYRGKVVGDVCDNRLLVKVAKELESLLPSATLQLPYEGAKPMILIENYDPALIKKVFEVLYSVLPEPKKKKSK